MSGDNTPPVRALVAVAVYAVIAAGSALILYALTPVDTRPLLLNRFTLIVPAIIAGVPGVLAWASSKRNEKTLNGNLEARIKQSATDALHETGVVKAVRGEAEPEVSPSMPDRPKPKEG